MSRTASVTACPLEAHAVAGAELGPASPKRIETCPAALLIISFGTVNGLMRSGPGVLRTLIPVVIVSIPPIPDPMTTPPRSGSSRSKSIPECSTASAAAQIPRRAKRSIRLASRAGMHTVGSKSFTCPPMRVDQCFSGHAAKFSPRASVIPLRPASSEAQISGAV